jgi:hypothetical protein
MIKSIFSLILVFLSLNSFALGPVQIMATTLEQTFDLSGEDGFDGRDGANAYPADCSDGRIRNGRNGEDGGNGEAGDNGRDALIYFKSINDLKKLTIFQAGGLGGLPGKAGLGAEGCNGGNSGVSGQNGVAGRDGNFGKLFLIEESIVFEKANSTRVISLGDFHAENITLSRHIWTKVVGAKNLLNVKSYVADEYYLYDKTVDYSIQFVWSATSPIENFTNTRLALTVKNDQLQVTSYSGAIIDYKVKRKGNDFVFEVVNAISELEFKNLTFGKIRGEGEDLVLEVKEKYRPSVKIKTKFVLSLYHRVESSDGFHDVFIGQFPVSGENLMFEDGVFYLMIGSLNFPSKYKKHDTKLRIHMSIYREVKNQTRVHGIKGLFRI